MKFDLFKLERGFRQIHKWLGVLLLPWVIAVGFTGIYLNHERLFERYLPFGQYDEAMFDEWPDPVPVDISAAYAIALIHWPQEFFSETDDHRFRGRDVYELDSEAGTIIVDAATGHYWVQTRYMLRTYTPDFKLAGTELRWRRLLNSIHQRGWVGNSMGTWLADITGAALIVFGATGLYLFVAPRMRKRRNQKKRRRTA
jgi:hypothetical protein